jgi:hypothetical protein
LIRSQYAYKIKRECGRVYFGELGRPLGVKLRKHKYNLKDGHLDKLKVAIYAFEEGHKIDWTHAPILQIELLLGNRNK